MTSYGSTFGSAGTYSYRSPGYGTRYGTSFPGGTGQFGGSGFGKKYVGMGLELDLLVVPISEQEEHLQ